MKTGMLWFDDDPKRSVDEKIERAARRFVEKYGVAPNLCYANPRTVGASQHIVAFAAPTVRAGKGSINISMKQASTILPNHFWLGVSES
jgi:hypothetical protein